MKRLLLLPLLALASCGSSTGQSSNQNSAPYWCVMEFVQNPKMDIKTYSYAYTDAYMTEESEAEVREKTDAKFIFAYWICVHYSMEGKDYTLNACSMSFVGVDFVYDNYRMENIKYMENHWQTIM